MIGWVLGALAVAAGIYLAGAVIIAIDEHYEARRCCVSEELQQIHNALEALRKEMTNMAAITAEMLDQLLTIAEQLLAADPNDKEQIAQLQAQVQALTADVADFNDPARAARVQSFLDAAAAATPAPAPEG